MQYVSKNRISSRAISINSLFPLAVYLLGHAIQWLQVPLHQRLQDGGVQHTVVMVRDAHAREQV